MSECASQEAYRHLQSVDPTGGKDAVDEFLQDWLEESKVPGWGDFSEIESPAIKLRKKGFPWLKIPF